MTTPDDRTLDDLVADRYRLMSSAERDELVRHMADAIAALRERIAALEAVVAAADELNNALIAEQYPRISYLRSEYTAARAALEEPK